MKILRLLALCLSVFLLLPAVLPTAEAAAPAEVAQAAAQGLTPFLAKIPAAAMAQFGIEPDAKLDSASLGAPFQLHTITPAALAGYKAGASVASLITPTTMWYFPVLVGGECKLILVVDRMNGKWEAVSLGYHRLAAEWAKIKRQWPESGGYNPILIAVFQARQHLFTVPEKGAANLTPLAGTAPAAGPAEGRYAALGDADSVIRTLVPIVENNLQY